MPSQEEPPTSRTTYVVSRLREDLATGVIRPGELLKQTVIAERYGVSPTPVREALRILESDGTIVYTHHRGATVRQLSAMAAAELYRVRAVTERETTQMAVERLSPADLRDIEAAHERLGAAISAPCPSGAELSQLNREFHFSIYRLCFPIVVEHVASLWSRFPPSATLWSNHAAELLAEHQSIVDAIRVGDAVNAGRLMAEHIGSASLLRAADPQVRPLGVLPINAVDTVDG